MSVDRMVPMTEYWSEVYVSRTIVSVAHRNAVKQSTGDGVITLLTQATPSRRYMLKYLIDSWSGPINVALYVSSSSFDEHYEFIVKLLMSVSQRDNIIVHIVISTGHIYPVNWLRNLVTTNASSQYIFNIDIDFIPSQDLMPKLTAHLQGLSQVAATDILLLVPAVELTDNAITDLPLTKPELLQYIDSGQADVFHRRAGGQNLWQLGRWMKATRPYLLPKSAICDDRAEPYVVIPRLQSPLYPETLLERGKNKVAYYFELCMQGRDFLTVHDGFILHKWHPASLYASKRVRQCTDAAFRTFQLRQAKDAHKLKLYTSVVPDWLRDVWRGVKCCLTDTIICLLIVAPFVLLFAFWYFFRRRKTRLAS